MKNILLALILTDTRAPESNIIKIDFSVDKTVYILPSKLNLSEDIITNI